MGINNTNAALWTGGKIASLPLEKMIKIGIVDDKAANRHSLAEKLGMLPDFQVVLQAQDGQDFLDQMADCALAARPLVVLMDLDMPIMNGIEAIEKGCKIYPDLSFLVLTVFDEDDKIFDAIKAGALGYLLKDETLGGVVQAIHQVVEHGGAPMSPRIARKALAMLSNGQEAPKTAETSADTLLSTREIEILKALVAGHDYKAIAELMFISPHTVRKHIANIYEKLHVTNRAQAVGMALRKRWF